MKKLLSLFILMLLPMLASAQTAPERRMLEQGKVWAYTYHHFEARETPTADSSYYDHSTWLSYYQLEGDTVIDGRTYMKLYRWDDHDRKHKYFGAFREDDEGKVFMYNLEDKKQDDLVLDFSLHYNRGYFPDVVRTAETIKVGDQLFRRYRYQDVSPDGRQYMLPYIAIEGIGFIERGLIFDPYAPEPDCICDYESLTYVYDDHFRFSASDFHAPKEIERSDYLPFVEIGKQWHVARFTPGHNDMDVVDYCIPQGIEEINGNNYYKMKAILNNTTEIETYLIREENRKVYLYDPDLKMEYLMFDFSLKEGDIYESYSNESHSLVRYRVVSVEDCTEGPQVREYYYDETADTMAVRYRYLRKWKVVYVDYGYALAPRIWIEGIGSLRNPFSGMSDGYYSLDHLTYIINNGQSDNYLPFSFNEWWNKEWFGCNLPIGEKYESSEDRHHQLTYELEGKRLHVYGKVFCNCGPNHYAYFIEEPREQTDDPLVRKFHLIIQDVEPLMWCEGLHATDFYVEGVNPAYDYYIVDNQGEEHHVINKAPLYVYRPFVEDGKVWAVKVVSDGPPAEEWIEYYYFDGDTIVNGQTAKRMLCDKITSRQKTSGEYVGAWYEQNKEVYFAASGKQQFELLYDFSLINYDTMPSPDGSTWVVYKWTGIYPGFKGTYFTLGQEFWYEGVGSNSWPFVNHPWGYDGDKGVLLECSVGDEVIYYNSAEGYPYGMGARKRFDFTHTIKTKPKARNRSGAEAEQSLYGEYNDQQLGINLNPLDYAYLVSITDETGKDVYQKAINAGSIVGLNIDISAYEKGRYTVTVENSNESFTGEFEAQTTGIEAIKANKEDVRSYIYNLHGQRLSTLQKGLNIVNGQKIYVK